MNIRGNTVNGGRHNVSRSGNTMNGGRNTVNGGENTINKLK